MKADAGIRAPGASDPESAASAAQPGIEDEVRATGGKVSTGRRSALPLLASRPAWVLAAVLAIIALGIGSVHSSPPSRAARIDQLDSIIKCPSCVDLSIAQSDAPIAVALRADVAAWVHQGLSDTRIEQLVVARFGEQVLLVPTGSSADVLLWVVPVSALGGSSLLLAVYLWRRRRLEVTR
ncbi:MAG TPA: cytochrome c-type biogenesis protein CcmH [Acidimicrobiales bacterium]|nr:cytochrome c-type biogenesis protein CcmH [Acidimicrobiales bacterium]